MDKLRCTKQVPIPSVKWGRMHQCSRNAVIGDKCAQHSPEGERKREERKQATFERRQAVFMGPFKMADAAEQRSKKMARFLWELIGNHSDLTHDRLVSPKGNCETCKIIKWLKANGYKKP